MYRLWRRGRRSNYIVENISWLLHTLQLYADAFDAVDATVATDLLVICYYFATNF